jgi:hypothetical protein
MLFFLGSRKFVRVSLKLSLQNDIDLLAKLVVDRLIFIVLQKAEGEWLLRCGQIYENAKKVKLTDTGTFI